MTPSAGPGVPIFMYHRVVQSDTPLVLRGHVEAGMVVDTATFSRQLDKIQDRYRVLPLDELTARLESDDTLPTGSCAITIDDCFSDSHAVATPILAARGISATFFPIGRCLADPTWVRWLDEFYFILDHTACTETTLCVPGQGQLSFALSAPEERMRLKACLRQASCPQQDELLAQLRETLGVQVDRRAVHRELYASPEQLREMRTAGMTIGAHSMTHPDRMGELDSALAEEEICRSREVVGKIAGTCRVAFAYPFGGPRTFNAHITDYLSVQGFSCGLTSIPGLNNRATPRFELRRFTVGADTNFDTLGSAQ